MRNLHAITRRSFLASTAAAAATAALPGAAATSHSPLQRRLAADPRRPQFHLLPASGWMNDPNGPIYHNGRYHMFFQDNPKSAVWGDIHWGHAVSPDMLHWRHLPVALAPTPGGPDAAGCFTGSCIARGARVYAIYTGVVDSTPEHATIQDGHNTLRESQCLAWSDDPLLIHWTKRPTPIVPDPPPGLRVTGFRDPSVWKQGDRYYMTVGSGIERVGGCVLLYESPDLEQWTYLHPLTQGSWSGKPATNPVASGEMWECPEFFPLDGGHVLIYSTEGQVLWQSGQLDLRTMAFHPTRSGQLDLGDYYAPKTQLDASGRRILWGWIPEKRPEADYAAAGWSGMMSLPRVLSLGKDGELGMEFLPALASLRGRALAAEQTASQGMLRLPEANGEFLLTAPALPRDFACRITYGASGTEILRIGSVDGALTIDGRPAHIDGSAGLHIHGFVDASVVSTILNGRAACTRRFYPSQAVAPAVTVSVTGAGVHLQAWRVQPISPDRLTTPAES